MKRTIRDNRPLQGITVLLLALVILAGCADGPTTILFYLANVTEIVDNSLDNGASVLAMAHDSTGGKYYVSIGGSIWSRADAAGTRQWDGVAMPAGAVSCTALTLFNDGAQKLYGGFVKGDGSYALYKAAPGLTPAWAAVTDAATIDGKQIVELSAAGGFIFVFTFDGTDTYNAYHYNGLDEGSDVFGDSGLGDQVGNPVTAVVHDGAATFTITTEDAIYTGPSESTLALATLPSPATAALTDLLYYAGGGYYYVSTKGGIVYRTADPDLGPWTASPAKTVGTTTDPVPFSSLAIVDTNVLVGSIGSGFYEMEYDGLTTLDRADEFTATELYLGWITGSLVDGSTVFMLTAGSGLWSRGYDDAGDQWQSDNWTHE